MQKYQNYDETGNFNGTQLKSAERKRYYETNQVSFSIELRGKNSCPTALACSRSGELCFAGYTDDSLHMIDTRSPETNMVFKSGGHAGMVKSIWVGEDDQLLYTGGSDGTVKLWDMATRSVIKTYGEQKGFGRRSDSISDLVDDFQYHTDTVTSILPSCMGDGMTEGQFMMSAGRDGAICEVDVTTSEYLKVH